MVDLEPVMRIGKNFYEHAIFKELLIISINL